MECVYFFVLFFLTVIYATRVLNAPSIPVNFSIYEKGVTRINLLIKPFESMSRYQDSYVFDRIIEVESVNYYGEDFYNQIIADNN